MLFISRGNYFNNCFCAIRPLLMTIKHVTLIRSYIQVAHIPEYNNMLEHLSQRTVQRLAEWQDLEYAHVALMSFTIYTYLSVSTLYRFTTLPIPTHRHKPRMYPFAIRIHAISSNLPFVKDTAYPFTIKQITLFLSFARTCISSSQSWPAIMSFLWLFVFQRFKSFTGDNVTRRVLLLNFPERENTSFSFSKH